MVDAKEEGVLLPYSGQCEDHYKMTNNLEGILESLHIKSINLPVISK